MGSNDFRRVLSVKRPKVKDERKKRTLKRVSLRVFVTLSPNAVYMLSLPSLGHPFCTGGVNRPPHDPPSPKRLTTQCELVSETFLNQVLFRPLEGLYILTESGNRYTHTSVTLFPLGL